MSLELGGGSIPVLRPNLDSRKIENVDIVADLESPLPIATESLDTVYSQFAMEHLSWRKVVQFIGEIYRILKPSGKATIVTSDLRAQLLYILKKQKWTLAEMETIFGSQDYPENTHKSSLSMELAEELFKSAGFNKVKVSQVGVCATDMQIEAEKSNRADLFDRAYFDGGAYGKKGEGSWHRDFPQHYRTAELILDRKPESVLEIGGARGYICKILQAHGIPATCMDISVHCWHTRAVKDFMLWDATQVPWDYQENSSRVWRRADGKTSHDLCFSIAFLEHVPEDKLEGLIKEMARVTKRGLHGITFKLDPNDHDNTHITIKPIEWWRDIFKTYAPDYPVEIVDKEYLEEPVTATNWQKIAPDDGLEKLNIGCFADMFYFGWKNMDKIDLREWARFRGYTFELADVTQGIPRLDNTVDIILASHFLEHLNREEGAKFLAECYRVLKPNGILRLALPDAKLLSRAYLDGSIMEFRHVNISVDNAPDDAEAFYQLLLSGHQTIYDFPSVRKALESQGFSLEFKPDTIVEVKPFESASTAIRLQTISMYPTLSLYVEARKPEKDIPQDKIRQEMVSENKRAPEASTHVESTEKAPETTPNIAAYSNTTRVGDKLKVALLSTPLLTVPPQNYGGLELIVANLGMELAKLGHEVTIYAPEGSHVEGCRIVTISKPTSTVFLDWLKAERDAYEQIKDQLREFDIIHGHNWFGMEYAAKAADPKLHVLHTHHGGLVADWWSRSRPPFKLNMCGISKWMKQVYEQQGIPTRAVYNGTDISQYALYKKKGERYLWLSRIAFFKAPHKAIELAKATGIKLDIAGATQFVEDAKYVEEIKKSCDGTQIQFIGEVSNGRKLSLLQHAKALLVTGKWGEPFGLHVIEAMATGTPVIAIADGGIAETVKSGGILCQDQYALEDAVRDFEKGKYQIPPATCRRNAMLFDSKTMALNYVAAYRDILAGREW